MNTFSRLALAAGLLATPALPALAQNGTPLTGTTSPTPATQPPVSTATHGATAPHHVAQAAKPVAKTHRFGKAVTPSTAKPATPAAAPVSPVQPAPTTSN